MLLFNYSKNASEEDAKKQTDENVLRIFSFLEPACLRETSAALLRSWDELNDKKPHLFIEDTPSSAEFHQISGGMTNLSFHLHLSTADYFLRVPGKGSEEHLSRADECFNAKRASEIGLNIQVVFFNPKTGLYMSEFIENGRRLSPADLTQQQTMNQVAHIFKTLHTSKTMFKNTLDTFTRLKDLITKIDSYGHQLSRNRKALRQRVNILHKICAYDKTSYVPCHNDTTYLNFLYRGNTLKLLDWEYSGNNKALFDLANFCVTSHVNKTSQQWLLQAYFKRSPDKQLWKIFEAYKQLTYVWYYLWAELQIANKSGLVPLNDLMTMADQNWVALMSRTINADMQLSMSGHPYLSSTAPSTPPSDLVQQSNDQPRAKYQCAT